MKRISLFFVSLFLMLAASAKDNIGWVYLNNGNIVQGEITTNTTQVTIITENGQVLIYPMIEVNRISYTAPVQPKVKKDKDLQDFADNDTGFWFSTQLNGSYAIFLSKHCSPWAELDLIGGYRFSQYFKVGIGFGARYYFENSRLRAHSIEWSFPVFATLRGNIISDTYRTVVPYYSVDFGTAIRDDFMWRPTIGLRFGQKRSAFLVGITYTGQKLRYVTDKNRYVSGLGISIGYEF